jgi:hypothetical protein
MQRSSRWPSGRRSGSRTTERETANLIAVPDGGRQRLDGLVIEASVVARLFRIRLLAIDASLVVSPAHVKARSPAVSPAHVQARSPAVTPHARSRTIGPALAAAERFIDEGAASLAVSRATGTAASRPRRRRAPLDARRA